MDRDILTLQLQEQKLYMYDSSQSATDWKKYKRDRRIWTHRLVNVESGLRQCKMRNEYVKKNISELNVCFDSVHLFVLYLNLYLILNFCGTQQLLYS